ncbi:MAG: hypothetical protein JSV88_19010 [Candidatus Aminicenantes bacterium]|nr:MAG: hypothetical protein JSV88_19010 [Candidatus Aminicenantes bacterium]
MRKVEYAIFFLLFASIFLTAKVVPLPDLVSAERLLVDDTQMYVSEGTSIYIYSLKDFQLKKKFGRKGEGPREFIVQPPVPLIINLREDNIIVTSRRKISIFSKDGVFKKETRIPAAFVFFIKPLGDRFTGFGITRGDDQKFYRTINIYDSKLTKVKEVFRTIHDFQTPGHGYNAFVPWAYTTYNDKIFIPWKTEFCIDVFDSTGDLLYSIKEKYKNVKVTKAHEKEHEDALQIDPNTKQFYERMKPFRYPDYFPAILDIRVTDNKIYTITYKNENNKNECFIFDLKGKLLKKTFITLQKLDINSHYPFDIKKGKVYQVLENEYTEGWDLHVNEVN